jgi:hypothetical protein
MNKLLALIGLAALVSITAQAQSPTYASQTLWTTNGAGIPAATAVAGNAVMDVRYQEKVGVQITAQSDTSGAGVGFMFVPSVDGSTYASAGVKTESAWKLVTFTPAQTATTIFTNLDTYGAGFMKLSYITNTTGAACTNISVKYGIKISVP